MSSHFSTIGLPIGSQDEFLELANRLADQCESIAVKGGRYLRWSSPCGAEAWLQVGRRGELIGMNPHFSGTSLVRVGLTARVTRPDATTLDGAFHAWSDPPADDPATGCYPFVFDVPDFLCYADAVIPGVAQAQIAAFAHEVSVYDSDEAYDASGTDKPRLASRSFIPSGLFSPGGEKSEPPQAHAILTGHVRRAEKRSNDLTGSPFYWAEVEAYGGVFDVVIDPELVDEVPVAGGVVSGSCWLSGRLSTYPRKGGVLHRLFGRKGAG
jgi:hypothetical protein